MPIPADDAPLIVTAHLDPDSFAILDALRRRYFPEHLNKVPAHISLFHHLPGAEVRSVLETIRRETAATTPFGLEAGGLRFLGRGVAISYAKSPLDALHARLSKAWEIWLTPQDRQPFRPHVTIQNKVAPDEARRTLSALEGGALPQCRISGVRVWRYLGGPWGSVAICPFGDLRQDRCPPLRETPQ